MRPTRPQTARRRAPRVSHRLFFALRPDDEVRDQIEIAARRLDDDHAPAGRWIKPHRYHLTLRYLGEHAILAEDLVAAACAAGDGVRAAEFAFSLDTAGSFSNREIPWWLGCSEMPAALGALWDGISAGLSCAGHREDVARRVPHVTILRDADRPLPPTSIPRIVWPVDEFVLIDSLLGPQARHVVLRSWRLCA